MPLHYITIHQTNWHLYLRNITQAHVKVKQLKACNLLVFSVCTLIYLIIYFLYTF